MMDTLSKNFEPYITMYAGCLQYIASDANEWSKQRKETGGPLHGLFTQGRRPVLMLAAPGGSNTCHEVAHFAMDAEYVTWLNQFMLDNFGLQYIGDWHLHVIDMDHASEGDINHIHRLAGRENLQTMVQLVLTREKVAFPNQEASRCSSAKEKRSQDPGNHSRIKVNAFIYGKAANGPYLRCRIKILPNENPIRQALANTGILDIPGKPAFEDFPFERIIYNEVRATPGTATERHIPYMLTRQLNELSEEISRQTEVYSYGEGRIVLSLPLSNSHHVSVTYTVKESPLRICSIGVFFPDTKTSIDITKEILMDDHCVPLNLIRRRVEDRVRESKVKRLTNLIRGCRDFASKLHRNKGTQ